MLHGVERPDPSFEDLIDPAPDNFFKQSDYFDSPHELDHFFYVSPAPFEGKWDLPRVVPPGRTRFYSTPSGFKQCVPPKPGTNFQTRLDLHELEISLSVDINKASHIPLSPFADLELEQGAKIDGHFKMQGNYPRMKNGSRLLSCQGVYLNVRRVQWLAQAVGGALAGPLIGWLMASIPEDYFRIPFGGVVLIAGRPCLEFNVQDHPVLKNVFCSPLYLDASRLTELGLEFPSPLLGSLVNDPDFYFQYDLTADRLLKMISEMQSFFGKGEGSFPLPDYQGKLLVRSLDVNDPDQGVEIDDGKIRIDFDNEGMRFVEGDVYLSAQHSLISGPLEFYGHPASGEGKLKWDLTTLEGTLSQGVGPFQSATLRADLSEILSAENFEEPSDFIQRLIGRYQIQLDPKKGESTLIEGGAVYVNNEDDHFFASAGKVNPDFDFLVSWKEEDEKRFFVDLTQKPVVLEIPGAPHNPPLIFVGEWRGGFWLDPEKKEALGPFQLKGRLKYKNDSVQGPVVIPPWLKMGSSFSAHLPFQGIIYDPKNPIGFSFPSPSAQDQEKGGRFSSLDEVTLTINQLRLDPQTGKIWGDLVLSADQARFDFGDDPSPFLTQPPENISVSLIGGQDETPEILWTEEQNLDDWNIFLDQYHLDRSRAHLLLSLLKDTREASLTVDGFQFNLPRSRMIHAGPLVLHIPKNSEPVLDLHILEGRIARFHFYFTKPLEFPPGIPFVRGFYFDSRSGVFRLDLINNFGDRKRPPEFYRVSPTDPSMTQALFKLLPLPSPVVDHLMREAKLDPLYLQNNADRWLHFLLLTLMAIEEEKLVQNLNQNSKKQKPLPISWNEATLHLQSVQFKLGTHFSFGGVDFELGDPNSQIAGRISLEDKRGDLTLVNIGKLRLSVPGREEGEEPLDILLQDATEGRIIMAQEGRSTVLRIENAVFDHASVKGSPLGGNLDLDLATNLELKFFEVRKGTEENEGQTLVTAEFDFHVQRGELVYQQGTKRAKLELEDSQMTASVRMILEERVIPGPPEPNLFLHLTPLGALADSVKSQPLLATVFKEGEWTLISPDLKVNQAQFSPGIGFDRSHVRNARVFLKREGKERSMKLAGDFDWRMSKSSEIPLAKALLLPRLSPYMNFDQVAIQGPVVLEFTRDQVTIERGAPYEKPVIVSYAGTMAFQHQPDPGLEGMTTAVISHFSGSHHFERGIFSIGNEEGENNFHVREFLSSQMTIGLDRLTGQIYAVSPFQPELSSFSFSEGEGNLLFDSIHLKEGTWTKIDGLQLAVADRGKHHNHFSMEGDITVLPGVLQIDQLKLAGDLYDEAHDLRLRSFVIEEPREIFLLSQSIPFIQCSQDDSC